MCMLSNDINDYRIVSQGKTQIPGVDDAADWVEIDVRLTAQFSYNTIFFLICSFFCMFPNSTLFYAFFSKKNQTKQNNCTPHFLKKEKLGQK